MRFQPIVARVSFAGFVLASFIALAASLGTKSGFISYQVGQLLIPPGLAIGLVGLFCGVVWVGSALRGNSSAGWRWGLIGLVGSALVVTPPLIAAIREATLPPIHDISTDIEFAPQFKALLALRKGAPNGPEYDGPRIVTLRDGKRTTVAALQKKYYEDVIPYAILIKPDKMFWRALKVAKAMGWTIVAFDPKEGRIEATDTSFWFGQTDDVVMRVRPAGRLGARLDIRSKSRVGVSDLGANAARIRAFIKRMKGI